MVKWLFFDLGSTLIDEADCEEFRLQELLKQRQAPSRGVLMQTMAALVAENRKPYQDAAEIFGLQASKWPGHLEKLYDSAPFVLEELRKRYSLGIIANQNTGTEERLKAFGIHQYFDMIMSSAEFGAAKPDPAIFLAALAATDCDPKDAVMIGDRLDNDIEPAAKLGMQTVWIRQGIFKDGNPNLCAHKPDYVIDSLIEILNHL